MMYLGNQAVGLNVFGAIIKLELNTENVHNAYVSTATSQPPSYVNSSYSYTYENAISVKANVMYLLIVTNNTTPVSMSIRNSVIVADNKVKEIISLQTDAGKDNIMTFIPKTDGSLILCVDKNYVNIKAYEIYLP